jgi:uncharacterized membrane protein (DUF485 family)
MDRDLDRLARMRSRVALGLTAAMLVSYFGFILLVAFRKPTLGATIAPGLSVGIALGAGVIVIAWALTGLYVRWADRVWDVEVEALRRAHGAAPRPPVVEQRTHVVVDVATDGGDVASRLPEGAS